MVKFWEVELPEVSNTLKREFKQAPVENEVVKVMKDFRTRVLIFYAHYCSERLQDVDALLTKYWGQEMALWAMLEKKYGPEPQLTDLFGSAQSKLEVAVKGSEDLATEFTMAFHVDPILNPAAPKEAGDALTLAPLPPFIINSRRRNSTLTKVALDDIEKL